MATKDEKFLKQARDRWKLADTATQKQRKRELEDLRFYAGDQWDEDLLRARAGQNVGSGTSQQTVPARPSLTINKTREPVRQVLNQERQSDLGITLVPADDFGEMTGPIDHSEIELREGLVRRIQRDSESRDARTWAFARAAIAGTGYWLVMTRYVPGKTQDQEVYVDRIYNQNSVLLDPSHEQPDGSDAEWEFWGTDMLQSAFKAQYPDSDVADIDNDDEWRSLLGDEAPGWFEGEGEKRSVRVMNYVYTTRTPKEVYHLSNGSAAYDDELMDIGVDEKGVKIRALKTDPSATVQVDDKGKERCHTEVTKHIKWAKITGNEILEQTDWPGHYMPIVKTVGEELQPYDAERRIEGIVRPMRDPCKGNNYIISKFVEQVGLTPIPPWMMASGQDEGFEAEYNASTTRAIGVLHYNQMDSEGKLVPQPPQRTNVSTDVSALAQGVAIFGQAIQSTSVMPETALGHTDPTVKSGKLARALIEQGSQGTSNFLDNLVRSLRHEARVQNDLLYPIYNRPGRLARMMNGQGEMSAVLIGRPFRLEGEGKQMRPVPVDIPDWQPGMPLPEGVKYHGLTPNADFNVAAKISKNIDTRRQEITNFLGEWIGAVPEQVAVIGDLIWKYMDLPEHEEIEKRQRVMLAPPIQELLSGNQPVSPQAQAKIAALEQQVQEMAPLVDKNKTDLMKAELSENADSQRKAADIESREKIERWKIEANIEIEMAKLGHLGMMKRAEIDAELLHAHNEAQQAEEDRAAAAMAQQQEQAHAQQQTAQEHQQQAQMQQAQGQQQAQLAEQGQQHALEQGEQGHQQQLEQQVNQAALTPEPVSSETP